MLFKFLVLFLLAESASSSSVKNLKEFAPFEKIEAEDFSEAFGSRIGGSCGGMREVGYNEPGNYVAYFGVDFEEGAELVTFRVEGVRLNLTLGYIYLRVGSVTAEPAASILVSSTGGSDSCNYINVTSFMPTVISGVRDLYLTFDSADGVAVVNIDWFQFIRRYV